LFVGVGVGVGVGFGTAETAGDICHILNLFAVHSKEAIFRSAKKQMMVSCFVCVVGYYC
jgi:hypothetical protein